MYARYTSITACHGAKAWEQFCSDLCAGLGVGCSAIRLELARVAGESLEARARSARSARPQGAARGRAQACPPLRPAVADRPGPKPGSAATGCAGTPRRKAWPRCPNGAAPGTVAATGGHCCGQRATKLLPERAAAEAGWIEDESNTDPATSEIFAHAGIAAAGGRVFPDTAPASSPVPRRMRRKAAQLLDQRRSRRGGGTSIIAGCALALLNWARCAPAICCAGYWLAWTLQCRRAAEFIRQAFEAVQDRHPALRLEGAQCPALGRRSMSGLVCGPSAEAFLAAWRGQQ